MKRVTNKELFLTKWFTTTHLVKTKIFYRKSDELAQTDAIIIHLPYNSPEILGVSEYIYSKLHITSLGRQLPHGKKAYDLFKEYSAHTNLDFAPLLRGVPCTLGVHRMKYIQRNILTAFRSAIRYEKLDSDICFMFAYSLPPSLRPPFTCFLSLDVPGRGEKSSRTFSSLFDTSRGHCQLRPLVISG